MSFAVSEVVLELGFEVASELPAQAEPPAPDDGGTYVQPTSLSSDVDQASAVELLDGRLRRLPRETKKAR
jgi:hypothetical protein